MGCYDDERCSKTRSYTVYLFQLLLASRTGRMPVSESGNPRNEVRAMTVKSDAKEVIVKGRILTDLPI
jgi:hypothetical protein